MNNSNFSILIYKIIGEPERWHADYIDIMNQVIDDTPKFDNDDNLAEIAFGEKLINRLQQHNNTLSAFSTLLDKSRFKIIILDQEFKPIYHNIIAQDLFSELVEPEQQDALKAELLTSLQNFQNLDEADVLHALEQTDSNGDQIYLRTICGELGASGKSVSFHLLLLLDRNRAQSKLNQNLVTKFKLSTKEQQVLLLLMHGKNIKEISAQSFISENTVKSHLKSIYRKTATNSQADVIRLMLTHESRVLDSYFNSSAQFHTNNVVSVEIDKSITLDDGNTIVYRDYGPADGRPLVMFHNGYGCRLSVPNDYQEILQKHNRRLIIMDRPGFGKSPVIAEHPRGWNQRMANFIDLLGLDSYDLLAAVLGTHMALSFAQTADHRLGKVILAGPVLVNDEKHIDYLGGALVPSARLVKVSKRASIDVYQLWLRSMNLNLSSHYRAMLEASIGSAERELFERQNTLDILINAFQEGSSGSSMIGIAHEQHFCMQSLEMDLSSFENEVVLWHGTEDKRYSTDGVRAIAEEFPKASLHICEGHSEYIYYSKFEDIIA